MQPIVNKKAYREYEILHKYEAGIKLTGPEVKAVKNGRLNFEGSYVKLIGNELFLVNADIPLYRFSHVEGYEPNRSRKLLMHRTEITKLQSKIKERPGLTIVALKCYNIKGFLKLEIALSKGRKKHELKSVEKNRELKRRDKEMAKEFLKH
ncbi:SsrA-binding protein [Candidatus Roizmanbacteria bacterium RIFOXYB2_FULL_41_10]|uniref:SsrA-binding protein n=1 Tax=Candidatus Roizmanbacteria bacterium RIFOXYA1_FULL_41_12 TaxID=1802082 RepID=A0A1F7KA47_9BACT|nr:MAG: SsrA-binding protein [Candidatus Roizmanbacteria bacterium RIFOXYA1_FULL_41_12]OGK66353.1 MAG: SsrA-binding protein [Candidatus Roizmanbacteria bacterium RIFOXYA2_FULL_41_8]OGK71041.1 MAG: SsrA-binding protein [Candidatus Roizmanbacteria bacterium RIFOXYB2_FULL_41_10]OGK71156.1 MAG: SsrA-binding protein [Candidatus Roizmanbacteria bacterium RIFOXYC1_FULL_41_16]OGK74983.1 MAG: SsrA-binding protein [Candidatus Roizmanbacteria bacterium RIFOXYD1_FULL_41_24]